MQKVNTPAATEGRVPNNPVVIVDYKPALARTIRSSRLANALDGLALTIEQVGSTAVPRLAGKPILDIDVLLQSAEDLPRAIAAPATTGCHQRAAFMTIEKPNRMPIKGLSNKFSESWQAKNRSPNWPFRLRQKTHSLSMEQRRLRPRGGSPMDIRTQAQKAEQFRKLHHLPRLLLLPNAWDVVSARILEECGHPAMATSSAAVAFSLGYPDGQRISRDEMLEVAGRIAHAVDVPVTADLEAGYGTTVKEMLETVKAAIDAGVIGMNLEDVTGDEESSLVNLSLQVEKIRAINETAKSRGVPFVLNARTDVYLMPIGPEATRFERTVERLRAYRDAGAACLFAPGLYDRDTIAKLVKAVEAPLNILANPACPPIPELEKIGVARVSAGSGIMRAAMGLVRRIGKEMLESRSCELMFAGTIPHAELNRMMQRRTTQANA